MPIFNPDLLTTEQQYKLMTATVIPRPIALVTTLGQDGVVNAAPFSLFNMIGVEPPMVMFSLSPRTDGSKKDTLRNIETTPEFVLHIVDEVVKDRMNVCSVDMPHGTSEVAVSGFATAPSIKVRPPRLVECPAQFECRVIEVRDFGRRPNRVVFGEVVMMHYHDGIADQERHYVDTDRLSPIGRLEGSGMYARLTDRFRMDAPRLRAPVDPRT